MGGLKFTKKSKVDITDIGDIENNGNKKRHEITPKIIQWTLCYYCEIPGGLQAIHGNGIVKVLKKRLDFLSHNNYNIGVAISEVIIMSPRTGRPKAENPKAIRYSIRLDAETENRLLEYCAAHNITKGEAIRRGIHLLLGQKK